MKAYDFYLSFKKFLFLIVSFFSLSCGSASAVLINFDDLDPSHYEGSDSLIPVSNEYESLGIIFKGPAYVLGWREGLPPVSLPNYLVGPGFGFEFVGPLPTHVSFTFGSSSHSAAFIHVYGPDYEKLIMSSGENHGITEEYPPYVPNEIFSFSSATGISSVEFSGWWDNYIDDLTFTYTDLATVPEPPSNILLLFGFLGLVFSRLRKFPLDS